MASAAQVSTVNDMPEYDVIIIGAGFSGLYALHKLRNEEGMSVRAFDAAGGVGGTWWYNRYPGARVDGPSSPYYSYMFSQELAEEWEWKETKASGPEVLSYLEYVAERFDLTKDIQFNTWVKNPVYNEETQRWSIETDKGERASAKYLICALGSLFVANRPDYPGIHDFAGDCYHTGRWPHEKVSFKGKRVAVIGTGSSGIQIIPEIANEAEHVTVFQRTAQYTLPARTRDLTDAERAESRERWAEMRATMRRCVGFPFRPSCEKAEDHTPEERRELYEKLWEQGGFGLALESYAGVLVNRKLNEEIGEFVREKIRQIVKDPVTAETLCPKYLFGTKRLILDAGYYDTYNRDNVSLIDVNKTPIKEFTPSSVRTENAEFDVDVLVLATGFDAVSGSIVKLNPTGRGGVTLEEKWKERYETYFGFSIPDFPNMFTLHGPGAPSVLFTIPLNAELTVDWIADCMRYMADNNLGAVDCDMEAAKKWGQEIDAIADRTLYRETKSWYTGANIPGKPNQFLCHPNGTRYFDQLDKVASEGYKGFVFEPLREKN